MKQFEKTAHLNALFSLYGSLLTDKQQTYFKLYYYEDQSLQEIASQLKVSRNAVFDQLKNVEQHLNAYEEKLHLLQDSQKRLSYLDKYQQTKDSKYLDLIRKMDE